MKFLRERKRLVALALVAVLLLVVVPVAVAAWPFGDVPAGHWAYDQIRRVAYLGITAGCGGGNYCPNSNITRAEMAVFIDNLTKAHTDENEPYIFSVDNANNGSHQSGAGIIAKSYAGTGLSGLSYGGSYASNGVFGYTNSTSDYHAAVAGLAQGQAAGVTGNSTVGWGVRGISAGTGMAGAAILGHNTNNHGIGVWGRASRYGVVGESLSGANYAGWFGQNIYVGGDCIGCTLSYAAVNDGSEPLRKGDMVAASGVAAPLDGEAMPLLKVRKAAGLQGGIVGVVQARGVKQAGPDGKGSALQVADGNIAPGDYMFIVVQGLAQVRVDTAAGVQAGDRLTANSDSAAVLSEGDVQHIGRAVDAVDPDTGLVWALVDLQ